MTLAAVEKQGVKLKPFLLINVTREVIMGLDKHHLLHNVMSWNTTPVPSLTIPRWAKL
jgi:hypothetical protein